MSILFHKNSKKIIKILFIIVGILVIGSMVLLYAPGFLTGFGAGY